MFIETKLNELRDRLAKALVSPGGKRTGDEGMKREFGGIMVEFKLTLEPTAKALGISSSALHRWVKRFRDQQPPKFNRVVVERSKSSFPQVDHRAGTIFLKTSDGIEIHGLTVKEIITVLQEMRQ